MRRAASPQETALTRSVHRILLGLVVLVSVFLLILWRSDNPRLERLRLGLADRLVPSMSLVNQPLVFASEMSRDYRNFFEHEGVRYSHTIDPATGFEARCRGWFMKWV